MKEFFKFLVSRQFLKHFLLAIALLILFFFGGIYSLKWYTHHNISITVPELRGKTIEEILKTLEDANLKYKVRDTVYFEDKRKLVILEQDPLPESHVKEGRVIYLTINGATPPNVKFTENILEYSLRNAKNQLENRGIKVNVIPVSGPHDGYVVEARYNGNVLKPGDLIPKGSTIDLYVQKGLGGETIPIPDFIGLTVQEVLQIVKEDSLAIPIFTPRDLENEPNSVVYKQIPEPDSTGMVKMYKTEPISLFLKHKDDRP